MEGSVIWLYCRVNSVAPSLRVRWTKDGTTLVRNVPHIRTTNSSSATSSTFVLVLDSFQATDDGLYQCTAEDGGDTVTSTPLTLTGMYMYST